MPETRRARGHGAAVLETGQLRIIEASLERIELLFPKRVATLAPETSQGIAV